MSRILIARRQNRRGLLIPRKGNRKTPNLLFPLDGVDRGELDELIRAILQKQGVTNESEIQAIVELAEQDSEIRIKIAEAKAELRRLLELRKQGAKLMQRGFRKWVTAFYPATKRLKGYEP